MIGAGGGAIKLIKSRKIKKKKKKLNKKNLIKTIRIFKKQTWFWFNKFKIKKLNKTQKKKLNLKKTERNWKNRVKPI